jgi:hypothetical protein
MNPAGGRMMKMILDATAGNRHIWGKNKYPVGVVFFDKETNLKIPADVIGTWDKLPFPDDSFDCIIFDPPFYYGSAPPYFLDIKENQRGSKNFWYGYPFKTKTEMLVKLNKAQKEFSRVSSRLCLKWCDMQTPIYNLLTLFDCFKVVFQQPIYSKHNHNSSQTWWVKLVRK